MRAAIEVGFENLTAQNVAHRLHVAPSAIYKHVDSMDMLVLLAVDELFGQMPSADLATWHSALASEAWLRYELEKRHRGLYAAWRRACRWSAIEIRRRDRLIQTLVRGGFGMDEAITATQSALAVAHEEAEQNTEFAAWEPALEVPPDLMGYLSHFSTEVAGHFSRVVQDPDRYFTTRIHLTLAGIRALLAPAAQPPKLGEGERAVQERPPVD